MTAGKIMRAVLGIAVVGVLGMVVYNWWGDFRTASNKPAVQTESSQSAGTTVSPTATVAAVGIVKVDGVNFREKPSSSAKLIRALKKGDKVTVIMKDGQWYKVKDAKGVTGWVTANGDYIAVQEQ